MRPSPETDALYALSHGLSFEERHRCMFDFARRLEGQRDELLEALQGAVNVIDETCMTHILNEHGRDCVAKVRAAIRKARGEGKA